MINNTRNFKNKEKLLIEIKRKYPLLTKDNQDHVYNYLCYLSHQTEYNKINQKLKGDLK